MVAIYDPFLNLYLVKQGLSGVQLGVLATILPVVMLIITPMVTSMADRHNLRIRVMQVCLVGWALALVIMRLPHTFLTIFPAVALLGLFRSPTIPTADGLIARMASRHQLNYGQMRLWGSIGFATVSLLAGLAWQTVGFTWMFWLAAVAIVPVLWVTTQLEEDTAVSDAAHGQVKQLLQDRGLVVMLIVGFLCGVGLVATYVFGGIMITELGGGQWHVGLLFGLSALIEAPIMLHSDTIIRRLGGPQALWLACGLLTLSLLGYALAAQPTTLILASILKGVGFGLYFVVVVRLLDERAGAWSSTAQAMMNAATIGLAPLLTSVLNGYVYDRWGSAVLFTAMSVTLGLTIFILGWAIRQGWLASPTGDQPTGL